MKKLYRGHIEELNGERGYSYELNIMAESFFEAHEILVGLTESWYFNAKVVREAYEDDIKEWWETPDGCIAWTYNGPYEVKNIEVKIHEADGPRTVYLKAEELCLT